MYVMSYQVISNDFSNYVHYYIFIFISCLVMTCVQTNYYNHFLLQTFAYFIKMMTKQKKILTQETNIDVETNMFYHMHICNFWENKVISFTFQQNVCQ